MNINYDSWHYKWLAYSQVMMRYTTRSWKINNLLDEGKSYREIYEKVFDHYRPTNFCAYWRCILLYPALVIFGNLLVLLGLISFVATFIGIVAAVLLLFFAIVVVGATEAKTYMSSKINDANSFSGNLYKTYRDNICTIINYKGKNDA